MIHANLSAAFALRMSAADADLIRTAEKASDILDTTSEADELQAAYEGLGERFAAVFPSKDDDPFGSYLELSTIRHFPFSTPASRSTVRTGRASAR